MQSQKYSIFIAPRLIMKLLITQKISFLSRVGVGATATV